MDRFGVVSLTLFHMNYSFTCFRDTLLIWVFTSGITCCLYGADGFDNNYVGGDANQLYVTINGLNHAVLFGPGAMSTGSFFIGIPNGTSNNQGVVSSFVLTGAASFLRSAYFDRVNRTTLYYRIYPALTTPPGWSTLTLQAQSSLVPGTCYTSTQSNNWQITQSLDVLQGLSNGSYVLEFYMQSELYDVGLEDGSCTVNALEQCNTAYVHPGRYISSRFNTTDPVACDLDNTIATQSALARIFFDVTNAPLPAEIIFFSANAVAYQVELNWKTAQEHDVSYFRLDRSADGYSWQPFGSVPAAGNSTHSTSYRFPDKHPLSGKNYYRLLTLGTGGLVDVSPVVELDVQETVPIVQVWPNPVSDKLFIWAETAAGVLTVFDTNGRLVIQQALVENGIQSVETEYWKTGVYEILISDVSGFYRTARILKN